MENLDIVHFDGPRNRMKRFVKNDKEDGLTSANYFFHNEIQEIQALDTQEQINDFIELYEKQKILFYKDIIIDVEVCEKMGIKSGIIKVYRHEDIHYNLNMCYDKKRDIPIVDYVAVSFGYLPAHCETTIVQVKF